jgi:hypothetical protein
VKDWDGYGFGEYKFGDRICYRLGMCNLEVVCVECSPNAAYDAW